MNKLVFLVLLTFLVVTLNEYKGILAVDRGYVFTAPRILFSGETESGCLSFHNLELPAHVLLELLSPRLISKEEVLASTSTVVKSGTETCLRLDIPSTRYTSGSLRLKIKFDKYPNYLVESKEDILIEHNSLLTFVETDKPIYKPGQNVNIRILMLKHDLKPWKKPISKVWINNPSYIRVKQWTNVSTENGMAQLSFPLSPEPSSGTWTIMVEKDASHPYLTRSTTFEVEKYILPRFQIMIDSPEYILADAENVTWNICVKYSYGKPVKGTLLLKLSPRTPSWERKPHLPAIRYETELNNPDGCTEYVLSARVLELAHWKADPNNIILIAEFTEAGTGIVENAMSWTVVKHEAVKLEFAEYMPKYFKLYLPYHGKLRVLRHDDVPVPDARIQVCLKVRGKINRNNDVVECRYFMSSADGFVDFVVPPQDKDVVLLRFVATAVDYPTKYYSPDKQLRVFMDQPSTKISINPWYSPSGSYLTVVRGNQPIVCGEKYSFNVMYSTPVNINESIPFHYSINSNGRILIYGHVKHKPNRDTILNYSEFRNLLSTAQSFSNDTDVRPIVYRFPLSVKVTPSMAPISELLLYYVQPNGEIVATTYTIEVGPCFENKVKTAWHSDVRTPGSITQYHVEAAPWSLCGISAVDKSTLFLSKSKSNMIDAKKTFNELRKFHPTSSHVAMGPDCESNEQEEINHFPEFASQMREKRQLTTYDRRVTYAGALQAFADFGVIVMSDLILETRPCPKLHRKQSGVLYLGSSFPMSYLPLDSAVAAAAMDPGVEYGVDLAHQTDILRSYFPETWLWELVPTGKEGKITIERMLPHTITDWVGFTTCISPIHGLGIAPSTTITAFQPFFLDYSLPFSVKRGEIMRLKVSLFNYMQHSLPVKIELDKIEGVDLHLSQSSASYCVKPQNTIVHEYILKPRVIGEVNITVSAFIDPGYPETCGPKTLTFIRDVITKPIIILPEGFPMEETKSALICPKSLNEDTTFTWKLALPTDIIPDSGRAYLNLIGHILGPALQNLDNLVQLPKGCAEQNIVLFAPNIHVIRYLDAVGVDNPTLRTKAIQNMEKGYQRELNYRHDDGSYSTFGHFSNSSIWLTAFVLKSFAQARNLIYIDQADLEVTAEWIMSKQMENGCFPVLGKVFRKQVTGGLQDYAGSPTALTAYILISLLESNVSLPKSLVSNAINCLEKGLKNDSKDSLYASILTTYALALSKHPKANSSMKSLMNFATEDNNQIWWEDKAKLSNSLNIEMTAYVILTLLKVGGEENMITAMKAVRWMSKERNSNGGFKSTQDTVVGLEAITKYATIVSHNNTDLSVLVTATNLDYMYRVHEDNRMTLMQMRLPVLPTDIEISVEGEGCVVVQTNLKYNVAHATGSDAFDISAEARSAAYGNECSMQEITICARYKMADGESNMVLLEVGMVSGYTPDRTSLHSLLAPPSRVKRFEQDQDIVNIYFDKLTSQKTCIAFKITRENVIDHLKPANIKLYDYYQQELTVSTSYKIPSICSSADPIEEETGFVAEVKLQYSSVTESSTFLIFKPDTTDYIIEPTTVTAFPDYIPTTPIEDHTVAAIYANGQSLKEFEFEMKNTTISTETNIPSPTGEKQFCPVCMDKLPSDIRNVYCSASSVAKVAIRRLRKARLLQDLHASHEMQRLHSSVDFTLNSNCSCPPLDTPGSLALIINKDIDFIGSGKHRQTLNDSFYIYALPTTIGVPCKLAEARASCSNKENIECTRDETLIYG